MDSEKLKQLHLQPEAKRRSNTSTWAIFLLVFLCTATAGFCAWPRDGDHQRVASGSKDGKLTTATTGTTKCFVAEIAPEASRQKGTLQIKVQVQQPDRFLTPELSAKVDFLAAEVVPAKK